ncbi:hypothetical protein FIV42_18705 [Persicimonas caeni]|uniref:Uncharacterized protein n=1 Tax=Persicimonas caeni TaxID=2292766 RepID=A0A4Y6PWI3_PERCE|nr:hypothetical protein [Persicimonas caeni]QDG52694.1 hypothetical protein FIV42_18705 [Persicimonas caeni]QED33916.1 hypothetical protein FRD00_18700 [Persicimonas caeni]
MSDELTIPATLIRREKYAPAWGVLLKPIEALISFFPSHRATKKGRQNAKQIRVLILGIGLAIMIFGGELGLILLGAAIMASALFLPMSEITKRSLLGRLKRARTQQVRDAKTQGELVHDGKRFILREDGKKLRRVLVDRGEHSLELRRRGESPCIGVRPPSGRKAESIWVCSPGHGSTPEEAQEISGEDVDIWAHVTPNDWDEIWKLLNK